MEQNRKINYGKNTTLPLNKSLIKLPISNVYRLEISSGVSELDKVKIDIEYEKIDIEYEKIDLELKKITLERDKLLVSTLIEDFKARWQELLNFENENSRWQTLYVSALILVVSWVLSNSGETGKYKSIREIFTGDNSYLLLSLALINAIYTLAMAYKGYQIQEIAQYLFKNTGNNISGKIPIEFNSWERWRRDEKGSPRFIRTFFYFTISILPTAVSSTILGLFYCYRYSTSNSEKELNIFFYFVITFVFTSLLAAVSTISMNNKWNDILAQEIFRTEDIN